MNVIRAGAMLALLMLPPLLTVAADAQTSARLRGTITAFDGKVLAVKSTDGRDLKLQLANNTSIAFNKPITLADLKPGDFVGTTATRNSEGKLVAREVHTLSPTATEGHGPMASQPGATMTNANIARTVKSAAGQELLLEYKSGSQTVLVPEGTPIVTTVPADRTMLVAGNYLVVTAAVAADGTMTAERIQVSKDAPGPTP